MRLVEPKLKHPDGELAIYFPPKGTWICYVCDFESLKPARDVLGLISHMTELHKTSNMNWCSPCLNQMSVTKTIRGMVMCDGSQNSNKPRCERHRDA